MRRTFGLLTALSLALVACSPPAAEPAATTPAPAATSTTVPSTTGATEGGTPTTSAPDTTATTSGRPVAPDFTLELGDGGAYTLSEGSKPVYLVFWAEW